MARVRRKKVDVILRDLDVVEYWTRRAQEGEFERDALLGYLAGIRLTLLVQGSLRVFSSMGASSSTVSVKAWQPRRKFGASAGRSV